MSLECLSYSLVHSTVGISLKVDGSTKQVFRFIPLMRRRLPNPDRTQEAQSALYLVLCKSALFEAPETDQEVLPH